MRNAKDAVKATGNPDGRITIGIHPLDDQRIAITVRDNGVGISQDNLVRIFSHGFTTKMDGHGFGLHSGALAAKQMGGSLAVDSGGANAGATFTLELPIDVRGTTAERMAS
jgi:signal transduction histidine kinase